MQCDPVYPPEEPPDSPEDYDPDEETGHCL